MTDGPRRLERRHVVEGFASGEPTLDAWLAKHARAAASVGSAQTYVVADGDRVVGYYAVTVASVEREQATVRATRGMPRYAIPVVLLARLAVDRSAQGRGYGALLLRDALGRAAGAAEQFGIRAVLVHAIDEAAQRFYVRHGFEPSPTDPLHLMVLIKDVRAAFGAARG